MPDQRLNKGARMERLPDKLRNYNFLRTWAEINRILRDSPRGKVDPAESGRRLRKEYIGTTWAREQAEAFFEEGIDEASGGEKGLGLVEAREDGLYLRSLRPVPTRFTRREANALNALLERGALHLFLSPRARDLLARNLERYAAATGTVYRDCHRLLSFSSFPRLGDGPAGEDQAARFRLIGEAVRAGKNLRYRYGGSEYLVTPLGFVASRLSRRLYMEAADPDGILRRVHIRGMEALRLEEGPAFSPSQARPQRTLRLETARDNNALERIVARFNEYPRKIVLRPDTGLYEVEIRYPAGEEDRVKLRLLALGDNLRILSEEHRELVREEAARALEGYR